MRYAGMLTTAAATLIGLVGMVPPARATVRAPCIVALKQILLIKRRPGMSPLAFRDYYELHHAPMAIELLGRYLAAYQRNFVNHDGEGTSGGGKDVSYDVVTELWFADRATFDAFTAFTHRPEVGAQIVADEERFMDRPATRQFTVDECRAKL